MVRFAPNEARRDDAVERVGRDRQAALGVRRRVHQQRVTDVVGAREVRQEPAAVPVGGPRVGRAAGRLAVDAGRHRRLAATEGERALAVHGRGRGGVAVGGDDDHAVGVALVVRAAAVLAVPDVGRLRGRDVRQARVERRVVGQGLAAVPVRARLAVGAAADRAADVVGEVGSGAAVARRGVRQLRAVVEAVAALAVGPAVVAGRAHDRRVLGLGRAVRGAVGALVRADPRGRDLVGLGVDVDRVQVARTHGEHLGLGLAVLDRLAVRREELRAVWCARVRDRVRRPDARRVARIRASGGSASSLPS